MASTRLYPDCWATFEGYEIIASFDLAKDAAPLFEEALRVLCLKTAVYELSGGDEQAAELVISAPVDEMVHAVLAQYTLCVRMTRRLGIDFVHMTDRERFGYRPDDYTRDCYVAAGWGKPNPRYWIDAERPAGGWRSCDADDGFWRAPPVHRTAAILPRVRRRRAPLAAAFADHRA